MVELKEVINPRQTVLITCKSNVEIMGKEIEKENIMPVAWHTPLSYDPPLYGIALHKNRFSLKLVRSSGNFIVNFMPYSFRNQVNKLGKVSGEFVEKFEETLLTKDDGETLDCPRITEALAYIECEVLNEVDAGDHVFVIGKVVHVVKVKEGKRLLYKGNSEFTTTED
jgi:flavin reductase (DIM6/NTAB) family NADH-FMN oxidoreductase RutF